MHKEQLLRKDLLLSFHLKDGGDKKIKWWLYFKGCIIIPNAKLSHGTIMPQELISTVLF